MDVPYFGTLVLCATLVCAAYTFAVAVAAGRGRPHMLVSARYGAYATCLMVAVGIFLLAYAFQTHDFRIRYVARYSDRSMEWWYLVTSLWGGQDGSLLWWSFLLCGWTGLCVRWMRGRYTELQPWVIATLMSILIFFQVLMLWAANPFAITPASTPPDGAGLNPLLQNYWMAIHPPTLYMGFIGWSVPFAFCIAALVTGRLHDEWIVAMRKWAVAAWLFLSVGLLLGALWSYEELGWGGYWAWDPVENASFIPWLVGTAFIHSVIVQERYGMLKVWNVFLMCFTFFLTIFGTFLTRAGLIASVHSFAKSDIGVYFVGYMVFLIIGCFCLIAWRLPKLRAIHRIESLVSREFAFLLNNWILLVIMGIVLVFTTFPLISELLRNEEVTVGPPVYNRWLVPFGLVLLTLMGIGPLISWRKATGKNLLRAFIAPLGFGAVIFLVHLLLGNALGFPPFVESEEIYDTATGRALKMVFGIFPLLSTTSCAFVFACISQEFWRGMRVRMKNKGENPLVALVLLTWRARRRYGGYIVHIAMVMMYIGATGAAYDVQEEASLREGRVMEVGADGLFRGKYRMRYEGPREVRDNPNREEFYTDVMLLDSDGDELGIMSPAKFRYRTHPEMPTTEVAIRSRPIEDVYVIMSAVSGESATFRVIVRPLVWWIWLGGLVLILGTFIALFPSIEYLLALFEQADRAKARKVGRAALLLLGVALGAATLFGAGSASAQDSSSLHAGTVIIDDPVERQLFERLLCMCGDCSRLSLANCACGWADDKRAELRVAMANGAEPLEVQNSYRAQFGARALAIPSDEGLDRLSWAVPVGASVVAAFAVVFIGMRWRKRSQELAATPATSVSSDDEPEAPTRRDEFDDEIDRELAELEGDE